jgi:DNA invertase Pin-like site-specific DNA recombinase
LLYTRLVRVIGYARVSTDQQVESGAGLDVQEHAIQEECGRRGWELVRVAVDAGASGKSLNGRPELTRALADLDVGQADVLLAAKLDRVSRSVLDFAALMARADRRGWRIVVLDVNVDTTSATGELMATVVAAFAQYERRLIGQRTKDALVAKKAAGVVLGRPRTLDPAVRERIVTQRAAGRSLRGIAKALTVEGVPTAQGGTRWYASTVRHVALESEAAV